MSIIANNLLQGDDGYNIQRSLRFRSSASAYLSRTFGGTTQTWTFSAWVKRGILGTGQTIAASRWVSGVAQGIYFNADNTIAINLNGASVYTSSAVFRDPSAWYHIVVKVTQSGLSYLYVNNVQIGSWTSGATSYLFTNTANYVNAIGVNGDQAANYFDGYLTEVNFIDGQALTPSSFGETDPITGVWKPKKYSGTYGTNGFFLNFSDNSSNTATTIGKDYSGNGNNWTPNNISVTAGATYDSMTDVPTLTSQTQANYCVWNSLQKGGFGAAITFSNANLLVTEATTSGGNGAASMAVSSGKYYYEAIPNGIFGGSHMIGILPVTQSLTNFSGTIRSSNNGWYNFSNVNSAGNTFSSNGDVVGVAFDVDAGKCWFSVNGTWVGSGNPSTGANPAFTFTANTEVRPWFFFDNQTGTKTWDATFGQRPFSYTPPTGFVALNTFNLPDATIKAGNKHFDATTYTGNGSTLSVTNSGGFAPDFVWTKSRSNALNHNLFNIIQGTGKGLVSNSTAAEFSDADALQAFNSNGFSVGPSAHVNTSGYTYVGWQWKAGGSAVSNTAGTITSQVSANPTAGFSVVTYTGTGANATVGHGLGVAPRMVIVKRRVDAGYDWIVGNTNIGWGNYLVLNQTLASQAATAVWNSTAPTSSVFSLGNDAYINASTKTYVAYCFAEIAGYSAFGSYTGNSSADGSFVYTGFRPRYLMLKRTDTAGYDWFVLDSARNTYNAVNNYLYPDLSNAEGSAFTVCDFLSNGFKFRDNRADWNGSGATYIYAAFAENPFKYSLAR